MPPTSHRITASKTITASTALCLIFVVSQLFTWTSLALEAPTEPQGQGPRQITGILKTSASRPITVNGSTAGTGATILSGAIIETPDQVSVTINLGSLGDLEIGPNTKLSLDFDQNGNVKVKLTRGCATLKTKRNVLGEIDTEQGVAGRTDPKKKRGFLNVCFPLGATSPSVVIGEAAGAAAAGGLSALSTVVLVGGIVGGITVIVTLRGSNPSPTSP